MGTFRYLERMLKVFLFYFFLKTATGAMEYGYRRDSDDQSDVINHNSQLTKQRYNQILSNIQALFKERAADANDSSKNDDDYNDFNYSHKYEDKKQFDAILKEVTSALDNIKEELVKFNNDGVLTFESPAVKRERRYKRDLTNTNATDLNVTSLESDKIADNRTETPEPVTDKVKMLRVSNDTVKTQVLRVKNDTVGTGLNGRRMIPMMAAPPEYIKTTSRVKDKLLSYLEDTFNEVERKIKPLTNIKIALSNDDHYRIGYIIATIDTLEVNLKKLKNDMNLHQNYWDDEKILDLFDRIKATNTVTTSLIESLKKYLH